MSVQHWRAAPETGAPGNHSWNIIKLIDGRILYCDLTAFSTNRINERTGEVYHAEDYRWDKITFNETAFKTRSPNTSYYPHGILLEEVRAIGIIAGNGTALNPYIINTADQLAAISLWVSAMDSVLREKYITAHYRLGNNINLSEYVPQTPLAWLPIGTRYPFSGVFDGNGKVISGLSIDTSAPVLSPAGAKSYSPTTNKGVFGAISGGTVKNLGVEGINIRRTTQIGGIAGRIADSSIISNCYTTGEITASGSNIGGIVGYVLDGSIIENCYSIVTIKGTGTRVGGIAGNLADTSLVRHSAALNSSVVGAINVERVYGMWGAASSGNRINNIAFIGMSGSIEFRNMNLTGCGGANITAAQIRADGTLGGRFTSPIWTTQNGRLPGFGTSQPLPDYIR
jgi:hypothetical protein